MVAAGWVQTKISPLIYASIGLLCELTKLDGDSSVGEWVVAMEHPWQLILIFCCNPHIYMEWEFTRNILHVYHMQAFRRYRYNLPYHV